LYGIPIGITMYFFMAVTLMIWAFTIYNTAIFVCYTIEKGRITRFAGWTNLKVLIRYNTMHF